MTCDKHQEQGCEECYGKIIFPKETKESIAAWLKEIAMNRKIERNMSIRTKDIIDLDKILNDACTEGMIQFDLESFKKSHPKLYISIKNAMKNAIAADNEKLDDLAS